MCEISWLKSVWRVCVICWCLPPHPSDARLSLNQGAGPPLSRSSPGTHWRRCITVIRPTASLLSFSLSYSRATVWCLPLTDARRALCVCVSGGGAKPLITSKSIGRPAKVLKSLKSTTSTLSHTFTQQQICLALLISVWFPGLPLAITTTIYCDITGDASGSYVFVVKLWSRDPDEIKYITANTTLARVRQTRRPCWFDQLDYWSSG